MPPEHLLPDDPDAHDGPLKPLDTTDEHGGAEIGERQAWDRLAQRLQAFRKSVGNPSYATIATRIQTERMNAGMTEHAARVPRSTVYDSFRAGRARPNFEFIHEIGSAMGATNEQVGAWITECHQPIADPTPVPEPVVDPPTRRQATLLIVGCITLNLIGREFVDYFHLPVYLDMVGTAIAAIALGPWRGALVGGLTNTIGIIGSGWISLPFGLVNIAGALMWGYGVRRWHMARTLPRFFALNILTALTCTLIAVPVIVIFLGHRLRVGHDAITEIVQQSVDTFLLAVGFSNLMTSTGDKLISGFVALVVVTALPAAFRKDIQWIRIP